MRLCHILGYFQRESIIWAWGSVWAECQSVDEIVQLLREDTGDSCSDNIYSFTDTLKKYTYIVAKSDQKIYDFFSLPMLQLNFWKAD